MAPTMKQSSRFLVSTIVFTFYPSLSQLLPNQAFAKAKEHSHGVADLKIAAEGKKIAIEFESPADSIYGFEHTPKTEADKKKQADGLQRLKEKFSNLVGFDKSLGCVVKTESVEVLQGRGNHSEVRSKFEFECEKTVAGTEIKVDFSSEFPAIQTIRTQVVSGEKQQGLRIKQKGSIPL